MLKLKTHWLRKTFIFHSQDETWATTLGGFPGGANGKESTCQGRRCKRCGFSPWVENIPWKRIWQPTPESLPGESHGQRSLTGCSPLGGKESDTTEVTQHALTHHRNIGVARETPLPHSLIGKNKAKPLLSTY